MRSPDSAGQNRVGSLTPGQGDALVIVDVQRDFLPGGALAVPAGNEVIDALNQYLDFFHVRELPILATRDWHPPNHGSFIAQGGPWPPHCIANSAGASFPPELCLPSEVHLLSKATDPNHDAYSPFNDTKIDERLRSLGVKRLFVGGLATDYCVAATVHDALVRGYAVVLLTDAIRAVNVQPDDGRRAVAEMIRQGAVPACWDDLTPAAAPHRASEGPP